MNSKIIKYNNYLESSEYFTAMHFNKLQNIFTQIHNVNFLESGGDLLDAVNNHNTSDYLSKLSVSKSEFETPGSYIYVSRLLIG